MRAILIWAKSYSYFRVPRELHIIIKKQHFWLKYQFKHSYFQKTCKPMFLDSLMGTSIDSENKPQNSNYTAYVYRYIILPKVIFPRNIIIIDFTLKSKAFLWCRFNDCSETWLSKSTIPGLFRLGIISHGFLHNSIPHNYPSHTSFQIESMTHVFIHICMFLGIAGIYRLYWNISRSFSKLL